MHSKIAKWAEIGLGANGLMCAIILIAAVAIATKIPLKYALIIIFSPILAFLVAVFILVVLCKWSYTNWKREYTRVAESRTNRIVIQNLLLPIILCLFLLYMSLVVTDGLDQANLFAKSPIQCETLVRPCGSSAAKIDGQEVVWDAADLISQPSENEVFVITNVAFGTNQNQSECPQTGAYCSTTNINPGQQYPKWLADTKWAFSHGLARGAVWQPIPCGAKCEPNILYDNGIQTGTCNVNGTENCNIRGWCNPVTIERDFSPDKKFRNTGDFSIFLDMYPSFPDFKGSSWTSGGEISYNATYAEIYSKHYNYTRSVVDCRYDKNEDPYCPRFFLKDIVRLAGGNFDDSAGLGGQFKIEIKWDCNFDWGRDIFDCLPQFIFINRLAHKGKPKVFSKVSNHEIDRRTVTYSLGIGVSIDHVGRGLQIQWLNLILAAHFVYVSYKILESPFLVLVQCIQAFYFQARNSGQTDKVAESPSSATPGDQRNQPPPDQSTRTTTHTTTDNNPE